MTKRKVSEIADPYGAYIKSAMDHRKFLVEGNRKASNCAHKVLIDSIRMIRVVNDKGKNFLSSNLFHQDERVILWSASHLLPLDEAAGLDALDRLSVSARSFFVQSSAETTASEWRKGSLNIDWFMD